MIKAFWGVESYQHEMSSAARSFALLIGICGIAFAAYCVHFDKIRRAQPDYKKRVKERRKAVRAAEKEDFRRQRQKVQFPDPNDPSALQKFIIDEVSKAESALQKGFIDDGVEHLVNVTMVSNRPKKFLSFLRDSLSPDVYNQIIAKLPENFRKDAP